MKVNENDFSMTSQGVNAVGHAKDIMLVRIAEKEKTRRLLIIVTAILVIVAALIMVFGPEERQGTNMIIGIILLVLGMGSVGASQFVIKAGGWEVSTLLKKKLEDSEEDSSKIKRDLEQAGHEREVER